MREKAKPGEFWLAPHCDDINCGLGGVWYCCPSCAEVNVDYGDVWFAIDEGLDGPHPINCADCGIALLVVTQGDWTVRIA